MKVAAGIVITAIAFLTSSGRAATRDLDLYTLRGDEGLGSSILRIKDGHGTLRVLVPEMSGDYPLDDRRAGLIESWFSRPGKRFVPLHEPSPSGKRFLGYAWADQHPLKANRLLLKEHPREGLESSQFQMAVLNGDRDYYIPIEDLVDAPEPNHLKWNEVAIANWPENLPVSAFLLGLNSEKALVVVRQEFQAAWIGSSEQLAVYEVSTSLLRFQRTGVLHREYWSFPVPRNFSVFIRRYPHHNFPASRALLSADPNSRHRELLQSLIQFAGSQGYNLPVLGCAAAVAAPSISSGPWSPRRDRTTPNVSI